MSELEVVEDFFGVYLLYCLNPKYKGRTYIGYTRDPNRRIMQHNRGTWAGGAYRTSNKGPWKMVLIIHGFPNNIAALRFEWAWQNPTKTTRLQHINLKKIPRKESEFQFKLRVASEMLRVGPWSRLPLLIRWLEKEYYEEFPIERKPPDHMKICHGPIKSKNLKKTQSGCNEETEECLLCSKLIKHDQSRLKCLNQYCVLICHITCLADVFLNPGEYIPVEGICPLCDVKFKWGDLIRKMKGCTLDFNNSDSGFTNDVLSQNDDNLSQNDDMQSQTDDMQSQSDDILLQNHDILSQNEDVITYNSGKKINDANEPSWFLDCNEDL